MVGAAKSWEMKRNFQIGFLKSVGLKPQHYVLDIGCGTLRGGIPIIEYLEKKHYFGFDSRKQVIEEAQLEALECGVSEKHPQLFCFDNIAQASFEQDFDYIWAFSVLMHMNDSILNDTLGIVKSDLSTDGRFFANVNIGRTQTKSWLDFPVVWRTMSFYENVCAAHGLQVIDLGTLRSFGHESGDDAQDQQRILEIRNR